MKDPEFYAECGYEDGGYVSPDLTSSEIYPDYIEQEVMETVRSVQEHQTHNTITFGFMTDLHLALTYNHKVRMQRNLNAYKEICKRAQVDFLALGGDYTNEGSKPYKSDCYRQLRAYFSGIDYYPVNGVTTMTEVYGICLILRLKVMKTGYLMMSFTGCFIIICHKKV